MKLDFTKLNWSKLFNQTVFTSLIGAVEEVADRWSKSIFIAVKLIGSLASLVALVAFIIVGTQWFLATYGTSVFVISLIVASFVVSVLTTASLKSVEQAVAPPVVVETLEGEKPADLAKLAGIEEK